MSTKFSWDKGKTDKELDKLEVSEKDIIIMKGEWDKLEIQTFAKYCQERGMNNILIVVPEEKALETMPIDDFEFLLKEILKKRESTNEVKKVHVTTPNEEAK